jgi:cholest-4-en-3-one 26-monooxygenase
MTVDTPTWPRPRTVEDPRFTSSPFEPVDPPVERLEDIDLTDGKLFTRGDPHAAWALLRREAPVFWHERGVHGTGDKGYWAVTTYSGCMEVHRTPSIFTITDAPFFDFLPADIPLTFVSMDPPEHTPYRKLMEPHLRGEILERWRPMVAEVVRTILDNAEEQGTINFHQAIGQPLSYLSVCQVLGLAPAEMQKLAAQLASLDYGKFEAFTEAAQMIKAAFATTLDEYPEGIPGTLGSVLLAGEIEGERLTRDDVLSHLWLYVIGADTATHGATQGMLALFHHPDQLDRLRADPSLVPSAVQEILRWVSPPLVFKRRVLQDTVLEGQPLKKGDYVATYIPSANRDERVFPDPYKFDITRRFSQAIFTFGAGPHRCIGRYVGLLELETMFTELLTRFPEIEQVGPAVREEAFSLSLSAVEDLPVRVGPGRGGAGPSGSAWSGSAAR